MSKLNLQKKENILEYCKLGKQWNSTTGCQNHQVYLLKELFDANIIIMMIIPKFRITYTINIHTNYSLDKDGSFPGARFHQIVIWSF